MGYFLFLFSSKEHYRPLRHSLGNRSFKKIWTAQPFTAAMLRVCKIASEQNTWSHLLTEKRRQTCCLLQSQYDVTVWGWYQPLAVPAAASHRKAYAEKRGQEGFKWAKGDMPAIIQHGRGWTAESQILGMTRLCFKPSCSESWSKRCAVNSWDAEHQGIK